MRKRDFSAAKRLLACLKPYRLQLALALLLSMLSVGLTLLVPVLVGEGVDLLIEGGVDFEKLSYILVGVAASALGAGVFQQLMQTRLNYVCYGAVSDIRRAAFDALTETSLSQIDSRRHGDVVSRVVSDAETVSDGLIQGFVQLFTGVVTVLATLAFMFALNWVIALVVVVLTPVSLLVAAFISKNVYRRFREQSVLQGELTAHLGERMRGQKTVRAFGMEGDTEEKFGEINARLYGVGWKAQFFSALVNPCTRFVNSLVYAAVGVLGALAVIRTGGAFSVGSLSVFLAYANQYTKPFNEISNVLAQIQNAFASASRVFEIADIPAEGRGEGAGDFSCERTLEARGVYFSYRPDQKLIEDFNLKAEKGDKIAVVGPTGCGKTTFINLLMRFYPLGAGEILADGRNVAEFSLDAYRKGFGMVLQDTFLKRATVAENIAYGREDATREEIEAAAKAASAHRFILNLPKGYDTVITEGGEGLSQGEKQLLAIARVMLADPPILILDEATSSIDTRTELIVQRAFSRMMRGKTSFIVAHRLSTVRDADRILVMDAGRIAEQGRHEELLARGGFYARLWNSQFSRE